MDCPVKETRMSPTPEVRVARETIPIFAGYLSSGAIGVLGGPHVLLSTLLWFICIDYAAGVSAVLLKKGSCGFDHDKAMRGIWKKAMYILVVLFAAKLDTAFECVGAATHGSVRLAFLVILNGKEATSIMVNLAKCGFTCPEWVRLIVKTMASGKFGGEKGKR